MQYLAHTRVWSLTRCRNGTVANLWWNIRKRYINKPKQSGFMQRAVASSSLPPSSPLTSPCRHMTTYSSDTTNSNSNSNPSANSDDTNLNDTCPSPLPTTGGSGPIHLQSITSEEAYNMTVQEMMQELDRHIIGQAAAKKAVAIAWRARWRRRNLTAPFRREVTPKNILMVGPTGCGKTEVSRRLAKISDAPFVKVEATKYTEVGYVGKDVSSIIEDLVTHAATIVKKKKRKEMETELKQVVNTTMVTSLVGRLNDERDLKLWSSQLESGALDDIEIEIDVDVPPAGEMDKMMHHYCSYQEMCANPFMELQNRHEANRTEKKCYPIKRARELLMEQEFTKRWNEDKDVTAQAIELAENDGVVFIDEIDKICSPKNRFGAATRKVSQEGVQRDLLPLIEGCSVEVQGFGNVNTDHVLFICAGAFHDSKPSDLMPELQGRLPVRVELSPLTKDDMHRILTETQFNLIDQQIEMLKTENCKLEFTNDAILEIAETAVRVNNYVENIGARRLHTVIEKVMEDINIEAPEGNKEYVIDANYVKQHVGDILKRENLETYIL